MPTQSPRSARSEQPREAPEAKRDSRPQGGAVDIDRRRRDDEERSRTSNSNGTSRSEQPGRRDNPSRSSDGSGSNNEEGANGIITTAKKSERVGGSESSQLLSDGSLAQKQPDEGNDNAAGDQAKSTNEEDPAERKTQRPGDASEAGAVSLGNGADDFPEDTVSGDGGRFQGMRSRMKKAGKGLMTKKTSASSARREKDADDVVTAGTREMNQEQPGPAEMTSSGETLPDTEDEGGRVVRAGVAQRSEGGGSRGADRRIPTGGPRDDSDTEGYASSLLPIALLEAEKLLVDVPVSICLSRFASRSCL